MGLCFPRLLLLSNVNISIIVITVTTIAAISIITIIMTSVFTTPGLHNKIPAHKIFAKVWVAQEPICFIGSG